VWLAQFCPEYDILEDPADVVFVSPTSGTDTHNSNTIARFTTSKNTAEGYEDRPWLLIGNQSVLNKGVGLMPACIVWQVDTHYLSGGDTQFGGRVRRNRAMQTSPVTEHMRILSYTDVCILNKWQSKRHFTQSEILQKIKGTWEKSGSSSSLSP
jgi:hypothetical protein